MEEHKHHGCCCDGHHEHQEHTCGCGGHHEHHEHHCGCGCHHEEDEPVIVADTNLDEGQLAFLEQLKEIKYLPIARFVLKSTQEDDFNVVALAPVFIRDLKDTMEQVKDAGAFLSELEAKGMISLDYHMPLDGYAYSEYRNCELFQFFCDTVAETKGKEGFLGDKATLELGSIGLTLPALEFLYQ